MKTVSVDEFRHNVDQYLAETANSDLVLVRDGKPYVVLHGIREEIDVTSADFEQSSEFWQMIHERRKEKGIPWEEAVKTLGL